jgi:hypothetical protein
LINLVWGRGISMDAQRKEVLCNARKHNLIGSHATAFMTDKNHRSAPQ